MMPASHDAALQEREGVLDAIGVDVAPDVGFLVLDAAQLAFVIGANGVDVCRPFIRDDEAHVIAHATTHGFRKRIGPEIVYYGEAEPSVALDHSDHVHLLGSGTPFPPFPLNLRIVNLDRSGQSSIGSVGLHHGLSDPMAEIPCRL